MNHTLSLGDGRVGAGGRGAVCGCCRSYVWMRCLRCRARANPAAAGHTPCIPFSNPSPHYVSYTHHSLQTSRFLSTRCGPTVTQFVLATRCAATVTQFIRACVRLVAQVWILTNVSPPVSLGNQRASQAFLMSTNEVQPEEEVRAVCARVFYDPNASMRARAPKCPFEGLGRELCGISLRSWEALI